MATGLTQELEQEYNRNKKLRTFFSDYQTIVSAFPPLLYRQTEFQKHLEKFEEAIPGKDITTTGITDSKNTQKEDVVATYAPLCLTVRSYALRYNNTDLAANMNFPESKISRMADGEILGFAQATNEFITNLAIPDVNFAEYDITPATLTDALALATDFNKSLGKAGAVSGNVTAVIKALEDTNDLLRSDVNDFTLIMSRYKLSNPLFFNGFEAVKKIDNIGVHHAGIEGTVTIKGSPYKNVTVTCVQYPKKTDKTDVVGHFDLDQIRPGSYEFTFTTDAGDSKTIIVKIEKGKMKTVDVAF